MKRAFQGLALGLLVLYLGVLGLLFFSQRSLLYPGAGRDGPLPAAEAGLTGFQDVALTTADGERLVAWWKPPQPGKTLVVYFHGNGGSLRNRRARAEALTQGGRGLLLVSYRGYSGSTGSPSEEGLRVDARAAYDWVVRSYEPGRIDAPYTSTADVASATYWFVPVAWLMLDQFRSIDVIAQVKAPILVMHGDRDRIIPFAFGERLYAAAPEPKRFLRLSGVGHTRVLESGGLAVVDTFLSEIEAGLLSPQANGTP
jgi:hypothetical protein